MKVDLKTNLEQRVQKFKECVSTRLSMVQKYAGKGKTIVEWLDLEGRRTRTDDRGYFRRLSYVYNRVIESLERLGKKDIIETEFPINHEETKDLCNNYKKKLKRWVAKHQDYEKFARPFHLADVVRRLKEGSELGPLLVISSDTELFTACYIHRCLNSGLLPEERVLLYKRIWHEVSLYVTRQRPYHDLSTIWWGVSIVKDWETAKLEDKIPKLEDKIGAVRNLLEISLSYDQNNGNLLTEGLLTEDGLRYKSYDRNGDLITQRRSLVYCYQNAVAVRRWLENSRNPRLLPLIQMMREWSDSCAKYWLGITHTNRLYDAALDLAFCAEWWKDRVSHWKGAIAILENGVNDLVNKSQINTIATTNDKFAGELTQVVNTVLKFREADNIEKPLVVALFGPPGTGKSAVAKGINKASLIELNLSVYETPKELFTTLDKRLNKTPNPTKVTKPILFLDEFDTRLGSEYWYRWLLTLLWDAEFPVVTGYLVEMKPIPKSSVVFLAASRYEKFEDFRDFALSHKAKDHKAADFLTRIDTYLNLPHLKPPDRVLVMNSVSKKHAKKEVLALCYMAELEDNARGIAKLLKGVDLKSDFGVDKLTPAAKENLSKAAGLLG